MDSITIKDNKTEVYPLKCATKYSYYVRARNIYGWGPLSDLVTLTSAQDDVNPPTPVSLVATSGSDEGDGNEATAYIDFQWTKIGKFDDYQLAYRKGTAGTFKIVTVTWKDAGPIIVHEPGFKCGIDVHWKIRCFKKSSKELQSDWAIPTPDHITTWTPTLTVPDGLSAVTGEDTGTSEDESDAYIDFTWNRVAGLDYQLQYKPSGGSWATKKLPDPGSGGTITERVGGLKGYKLYNWRVRASKGTTLQTEYANGPDITTWKTESADVDPPVSVTLEILPTDKFKITIDKPDVKGIKGGNIYVNTSNDPGTALVILRCFRTGNTRNISPGDVSEGGSPITIYYDTVYYFWVVCFDKFATESSKVASDPASGAISSS
jgi:hypothetical protein